MQPTLLIRLSMLLLAAVLANCATNPVSGNPNFVVMSESQEVQVGRTEDPKIRAQYGVYPNAALQQYVNEVGQRLAKASHRPQLEYHFTVVDSPEINAFALPGGYIYITRGILAYLNSESELAAVLGHELGHVTARHSVQQMGAATAAQVGAALLQIFVPQARGSLGDAAINLAGGALLSGYSREHEYEADRLGAEYLARTGYETQAIARVVGVLKTQELFDAEVAKAEGRQPRAHHGLFATHPDSDSRAAQAIKEAERFARPDARAAREDFLRRIDRTTFGDSAAQGVVRNNNFYHTEMGLAVSFPQGWRVRNGARNVVALSPAGDAMVDLRAAGPAQGSPADVLRKFVQLGFGAQIASTSINGLPAAVTTTSIQGRPTRVAVIFLGKSAYALGAQARDARTFNQVQGAINASLESFHAITEKERLFARPLRLRIVTAREGMTFAELARTSPIGRFAEGHLRAINGMYPAGEPVAGQPLKIVE